MWNHKCFSFYYLPDQVYVSDISATVYLCVFFEWQSLKDCQMAQQ